MPNIRHIAKTAGVSITTVSRVLNNLPGVSPASRAAVLAAVNQAGYVPGIGRRSTSNIALLYTDAPTLDSPFDAALLVGLHEGVAKLGCDLVLLDAPHARGPGETFSHMFLRKGIQGALLRTTHTSRNTCELILREGFPSVVVGYRLEDHPAACVYSDSREASTKAIEHLLALGHTRIAVCIHVVEDSDHTDRVAACRGVLQSHGLPFDDRLVIRVPASRDGGVQAVRRILSMADRPTALFLTDPLTSLGALGEARRLSLRIPQDLSIVGFDDADLRHGLVPPLTAVCQNTRALGREAAALLGNLITHRANGRPTARTLRCWFEVHDTTAPAPARRRKTRPLSPRSRSRQTQPSHP